MLKLLKKRPVLTCVCAMAIAFAIGVLVDHLLVSNRAVQELEGFNTGVVYAMESCQEDLFFDIEVYINSDGYASGVLHEIRMHSHEIMGTLRDAFYAESFMDHSITDMDFDLRQDVIRLYGSLYATAYELQKLSMDDSRITDGTIVDSEPFRMLCRIRDVLFPSGPTNSMDEALEHLQSEAGQELLKELKEIDTIYNIDH